MYLDHIVTAIIHYTTSGVIPDSKTYVDHNMYCNISLYNIRCQDVRGPYRHGNHPLYNIRCHTWPHVANLIRGGKNADMLQTDCGLCPQSQPDVLARQSQRRKKRMSVIWNVPIFKGCCLFLIRWHLLEKQNDWAFHSQQVGSFLKKSFSIMHVFLSLYIYIYLFIFFNFNQSLVCTGWSSICATSYL